MPRDSIQSGPEHFRKALVDAKNMAGPTRHVIVEHKRWSHEAAETTQSAIKVPSSHFERFCRALDQRKKQRPIGRVHRLRRLLENRVPPSGAFDRYLGNVSHKLVPEVVSLQRSPTVAPAAWVLVASSGRGTERAEPAAVADQEAPGTATAEPPRCRPCSRIPRTRPRAS